MGRIAGEAGWRVSRYNVAVKIPDSDKVAVANLFRVTCGAYTPLEMYLLDEINLTKEAFRFQPGHGVVCGAHHLYGAGIDDQGRLYKCWEDVDKPEHSFGSARRWDPADPIATADAPDHLTQYLNTALPTDDPECRDYILLPQCAGGCPTRRLYYQKSCFGFRNAPEKIVLALYERLQKETKQKAERKEEKP